jgi:hypothetical protein
MIFAYHTILILIRPGGGPAFTASLRGVIAEAGGATFGLFPAMIGLASDEMAVITAWADADTAARADAAISGVPDVLNCSTERLVPTVRPIDATPPHQSGVYAHRWFWVQPQDWPEFQRLSEEGIWPYFEADGCRIVGLWRSIEPGQPAKALLLTYYPTVAHWERTRLQSPDAPPGADERLYRRAQDAGRARSALTERSIVRLTTLVPAAS